MKTGVLVLSVLVVASSAQGGAKVIKSLCVPSFPSDHGDLLMSPLGCSKPGEPTVGVCVMEAKCAAVDLRADDPNVKDHNEKLQGMIKRIEKAQLGQTGSGNLDNLQLVADIAATQSSDEFHPATLVCKSAHRDQEACPPTQECAESQDPMVIGQRTISSRLPSPVGMGENKAPALVGH
jgi:hypothetical protein